MENEKKFILPQKTDDKIDKKTLVLDLDETLIHSQHFPFSSSKSDIVLKLNLENNEPHDFHVLIRPGAKEFIRKMNKLYELVIFTASVSKYAIPLINLIDEKGLCIHRLCREHCSFVNTFFTKDLSKLGRDLKDIIIVDNSPLAFSLNKENGIPIVSFFEDKADRELYNLIPILEFLSSVPDVREFIPKLVINNEISYFASIDIMRKYKNENKKMVKYKTAITNLNHNENLIHQSGKINDNIKKENMDIMNIVVNNIIKEEMGEIKYEDKFNQNEQKKEEENKINLDINLSDLINDINKNEIIYNSEIKKESSTSNQENNINNNNNEDFPKHKTPKENEKNFIQTNIIMENKGDNNGQNFKISDEGKVHKENQIYQKDNNESEAKEKEIKEILIKEKNNKEIEMIENINKGDNIKGTNNVEDLIIKNDINDDINKDNYINIIRDNKNYNYIEENDDIILNSNKNNINNKIEDEYYQNNNDINDKINNENIIDKIIIDNKANSFDNIDNSERIKEIPDVNNIINEKNEKKNDVNNKKEIEGNNNKDIKENEDIIKDNLELIIKEKQRIEYSEPKIDRIEKSNSILESKSLENKKNIKKDKNNFNLINHDKLPHQINKETEKEKKNNINKRTCKSAGGKKLKKIIKKSNVNLINNDFDLINDQRKNISQKALQNYEYAKSMLASKVKNNEEKINVLENLENTKNDKEKKIPKCKTKKKNFKKNNMKKNEDKSKNDNLDNNNELKEKNKEEKLKLKNIKSNSIFKNKRDINRQKNNLVNEDANSQLLKSRKKTLGQISPTKDKNDKTVLLIEEKETHLNELTNNSNHPIDNFNNNSNRKSSTFRKNNTNVQIYRKNSKKEINSKQSPNIINQKNLNFNRNEFKMKSNEINKNMNRVPWGWGGNTTKNIETAKKIKYNIEIKSFRHEPEQNNNTNNMSKSQKKINDYKNYDKKSRNIEENEIKRKRGISSYSTLSGSNKDKKKEEEKI